MEGCHICGRPATQEALVEGTAVFLCPECMHYGKPINKPVVKSGKTAFGNVISTASAHSYYSPKPHIDLEPVPNYGKRIRSARESLHMTRKELANKLFIGENVVERLEDELLKPEHKVAEKLEQFLKIKLIEREGEEEDKEALKKQLDEFRRARGKSSGLTVADVIDIKIKEKK